VSDILDYRLSYERGQALADLCRSYEIGPELLDDSGNLDRLIARVLEDCERRLRELPEPVFEAGLPAVDPPPERDRELQRVRGLVTFVKEAAALRECGDTAFSMVSHVDDLERLKHQGAPDAEESVRITERVLELCSDISRLCHKINNPLTSLMGRAQMLQLQPNPAPEKILKATEVIEESARRVASVVQELAQVVCQGKEDLLTK